jgi:sulfur carrier protein
VAVYTASVAVGGGFLRTGCGPGPLEPDLDNPSVGNTAEVKDRAAPDFGGGRFGFWGTGVTITVNGKPMEVAEGLSLEALLAELGVPRQYTAVAINREVTPRSRLAQTVLRSGDRVEIVRPMGGG